MSDWGLLVKDKLGNTSLNPDSFTVRLVETLWMYAGILHTGAVVDIPTSTNVLAGMFAVATVHDNYYVNGYPDLQPIYPIYPLAMPAIEVYNGLVRVRGSTIVDGYVHGYLAISIMSYI